MATNRYKEQFERFNSILSAIELLCGEHGKTTPTDVLSLCQLNSNMAARYLVLKIAYENEYTVENSGRGHVISDQIWNE